MELDSQFRKALKLLHTRSDEATIQLRQMLDDALALKRASMLKEKSPISPKVESETVAKVQIKKASPREDGSGALPSDSRKRDAEKRQLERTKNDSPEFVVEPKRIKTEYPQEGYDSPTQTDLPKPAESFYVPKIEDDTDSSDGNADDFAMEMDLVCVICKQIDVSHGNQLIECQECHNLYHQECHRPPATDHDVNDPRSVWYCAKCTKNIKKMASKTQKTTKTSSSVMCKDTISQNRTVKSESSVIPSVLLPFKRTELKAPPSQGNNTSVTNKPIGLAGLAANLSGRSAIAVTSSSTSSTRTTTSKPVTQCPTKTKTFGTFTASYPSSKTVTPGTSATASSKSLSVVPSTVSKTNSSGTSYVIQTVTASSASTATKGYSSPSNSAPKPSSSALSSIIAAASSRTASSNNGNSGGITAGGAKPASSSSLMSADKRLQIMKKKAAKMQEKRRLSTK